MQIHTCASHAVHQLDGSQHTKYGKRKARSMMAILDIGG
jgi:hypothetical protein